MDFIKGPQVPMPEGVADRADISRAVVDTTPLIVQSPRIIPQAKRKPRVVVVETVYHQGSCASDPTAFEHRSSRNLKSEDAALRRQQNVGTDWTAVESAFVVDASLIIVEAPPDAFIMFGTLMDDAVVDMGVAVMPGESVRFTPTNARNLRLRSPGGMCRPFITLVPK